MPAAAPLRRSAHDLSMGIPGLASRLSEYALTKEIGCKTMQDGSNTQDTSAIIVVDGPSLANSLFKEASARAILNDDIVSPCHYEKIGNAVVSLLNNLQSYGLKIGGIYFDGALPAHKTATRIARLKKSMTNLDNFKRVYDRTEKKIKQSGDDAFYAHAPYAERGIARQQLAPPPFLVIAVIEALLKSAYADRTWIVPGEADHFCAAATLIISELEPQKDIKILTSDSDLIIHSCADRTSILMPYKLWETECEGEAQMVASAFKPKQLMAVASTVGTEAPQDLIGAAYAMLQNTRLSFKAALLRPKGYMDSDEYRAFADLYNTNPARFNLLLMQSKGRSGYKHARSRFDPRTSEIIEQIIDVQKTQDGLTLHGEESQAKETQPTEPLHIYLPMLFEDPDRASAWVSGEEARVIAYSVATSGLNFEIDVQEHRKRTVQTVGTGRLHELNDICGDFADSIFDNLPDDPRLRIVPCWRWLVMKLTLLELMQSGLTMPRAEDVLCVLSQQPRNTWARVHLSAEYEAQYYSLRMLKQTLEHTLGAWKAYGMGGRGWEAPELSKEYAMMIELEEVLVIPSVAQFFDTSITRASATWKGLIERFWKTEGVPLKWW